MLLRFPLGKNNSAVKIKIKKKEKILENCFSLLFISLSDCQFRVPRGGVMTAMELPDLCLPGGLSRGMEVVRESPAFLAGASF